MYGSQSAARSTKKVMRLSSPRNTEKRTSASFGISSTKKKVSSTEQAGESKEKNQEKSKEKMLALLSTNPHATTADLIAETGLSVSGVEKNIRELKATGRLRRVGPDKGGHWEVVEGQ